MQVTAIIIASLFFLLGVAGTVLPVLPGPFFIIVGMLIYGIMTDFSELGLSFFIIQGFAAMLVFLFDYLAVAVGSRKFGGSKYALWGAVIGLFLGVLLLNIPGLIIGPFAGAFIGELIKGIPPEKALRSSTGTLAGLLGSFFIKFFIEAVMISWFFYTILK